MPVTERVTMAEIAEQSGVSPAIVSLVLREKPGIGTETRQRVLQVVKELGYTPNYHEVTPATSSVRNIGLPDHCCCHLL